MKEIFIFSKLVAVIIYIKWKSRIAAFRNNSKYLNENSQTINKMEKKISKIMLSIHKNLFFLRVINNLNFLEIFCFVSNRESPKRDQTKIRKLYTHKISALPNDLFFIAKKYKLPKPVCDR